MRAAFDPEDAVRHLADSDRLLGRLIDRIGSPRLWSFARASPFEALAESIAYQQLTGKAAATIFGRVRALYPPGRFPAPEAVLATPDGRLREAGLSRAKTAAIKDLAAKTIEGVVPARSALARLDDEAIIDRLTQVRGIGRWTVEMLLLGFGRPDVLPATDYGIRKGYARTFRTPLPAPAQVLRRGERWRPFRSVASWYLWKAVDGLPGGRT